MTRQTEFFVRPIPGKLVQLFLVLLSLACLNTPACAADSNFCVTIGVGDDIAPINHTPETIQALFDRAGFCVKVLIAPPARIDAMEKEGTLDGDAWRVESYFATNKNMVMVPTPVRNFVGVLIWRDDQPEPRPGAVVGYVAGNFWAVKALEKMKLQGFVAHSSDQLLQMAESNRISGILMPENKFLRMSQTSGHPMHLRNLAVFQDPLHLAISQKYRDLVPKLDDAMRSLFDEGFLPIRPDAIIGAGAILP